MAILFCHIVNKMLSAVNIILPHGNIGTMIVSAKIKRIRESKGMNARALAKASGVTPGVISRIEAKHRQPKTDTLQRIAAALEVSVSYLLGEEDEDLEFPVALRRQALQKALKVVPAGDAHRAVFEEMCYKDSAPTSVQSWKDLIENIAFFANRKIVRELNP